MSLIDLDPRGQITIDDKGRTSAVGVFAGGDCTNVPYKQIWLPKAVAPPRD